jgi:hypothetical protein
MYLRKWHRSDIMTEVLDTRAVVVGSPTLNNGLFPTVSDILTYMKGLKPKNKIGAAFGSYGWSGESVKLIQKELEAMKFEILEPGLRIQYIPDDEGLNACYHESLLLTPATILGTPAEAGLNQKNSTSLALGTQTAFDFYPPQIFGGQAPCYSRRLKPKMLNGARKNLSNLWSNFVTYLRDTILVFRSIFPTPKTKYAYLYEKTLP